MPTGSAPGPWVPKAFRPESLPTVAELLDLLRALKARASSSTYALFREAACKKPTDRLLEASTFVIGCMKSNPLLNNVLTQALTLEEYASLQETVVLPLTTRQRVTAEQLLCVRERELVASFFRRAFRVLSDMDDAYIHPFDEVEA